MNNYSTPIRISFIFLVMLIVGCSSQKKIQQKEDFKYSIEKPIEGQLHTAKRLKNLMSVKKYEEAIDLFSKKQQLKIRKIKEDEETFKYWCLAWALDDRAYEYYCSRIKNNEGMFVFEDGEWKIDEK